MDVKPVLLGCSLGPEGISLSQGPMRKAMFCPSLEQAWKDKSAFIICQHNSNQIKTHPSSPNDTRTRCLMLMNYVFLVLFFFNSIFISHQHKRMFFLFLTLPEMTLNLSTKS